MCARDDVNNREANVAWIATQYLHIFKATHDINVKVIVADTFKKYRIECSIHRLYRAKIRQWSCWGKTTKRVIAISFDTCMPY